jgi:hypothetical protein
MKLKIEFIDENTGQKISVKNKGSKVVYHDSEIHDPGEFETLTGKVAKLEPREKEIVDAFYKLAGNIE